MKRKIIKVIAIIVSILILVTGWIAFCGYNWSWGPFGDLSNVKFASKEGNKVEIAVERQESILTNKKVLYLGSSVTYGAHSLQKSFVEYISERNGSYYVKEAVSGTTLVDNGVNSYVSRLKNVDKNENFDLFVCQLSTNDATQKKPLGEVVDNNYDTKTICGAIQFIVSYVKETFNCPVIFYTGSYYESIEYSSMVDKLEIISEKMNFDIANLYNDESFNNISKEDYKLYMSDKIHPTRAGYYYWWTPYIEQVMIDTLSKS